MKTKRRIAAVTVTALLTAGMALNFSGCSKDSPLQPQDTKQDQLNMSLAKKPVVSYSYPQVGSQTYNFFNPKNEYRGGTLNMPNGTVVNLVVGSLTPPPSIPWGDPVEITCEIDKDEDNNELLFSFGPHGCQFDPPAKVYLDYNDLGIDAPKLYYIDENGNRIEQQPDDVDVTNRAIILYLHHFSRYAVGCE